MKLVRVFLKWYEQNLALNQTIVAVLFGWQVLHLFWLTTHVVSERLFGFSWFNPNETYQFLLITADYFEIPALISGTILYFYSFREEGGLKNILFILLINSQWLHIFWITDEFVLETFGNNETILPFWLAWIAIFIDYLELPVMFDTINKATKHALINVLK